jgi:hypothetical protein
MSHYVDLTGISPAQRLLANHLLTNFGALDNALYDFINASAQASGAPMNVQENGSLVAGSSSVLNFKDANVEAGGVGVADIYLAMNGICQFRATLSSGIPVPTSAVTAATRLYVTPYTGNMVSLYDGARERLVRSSEVYIDATSIRSGTLTSGSPTVTLTTTVGLIEGMTVTGTGIPGGTTIQTINSGTVITLSANATATGSQSLTFKLAANTNYDVYLVFTGGNIQLEWSPAWTGANTRNIGIAIGSQGYYTRTGSLGRRYFCTVRTVAAGELEDSYTKRFVSNWYNQVARPLFYDGLTGQRTGLGAWSMAKADSNANVQFVTGLPQTIKAAVSSWFNVSNAAEATSSIGLDATTPHARATRPYAYMAGTNVCSQSLRSELEDIVTEGFHQINWLEYANHATNVVGLYSANEGKASLSATVMG